MARPKADESMRKDIRFTARFTRMEAKELLSQSDLCELSVSELLRKSVLGKQIAPITDLKMLSELRRIGGLLKHFFNESGGLHRQKTHVIL